MGANCTVGNVANEDGRSVVGGVKNDVLDVADAADQPFAADDSLLVVVDQVPAAGIAVVLAEGFENVAQRNVEVLQLLRVDLDLVGLQFAAKRVDFDNSRHAAQLVGDLPVEDFSQLHGRVVVSGLGADLELVDLAQAPC